MTLRVLLGIPCLILAGWLDRANHHWLALTALAVGLYLVVGEMRRMRRHMYIIMEGQLRWGDLYEVLSVLENDGHYFTLLCSPYNKPGVFTVVRAELEKAEAGDVFKVKRAAPFGGKILASLSEEETAALEPQPA